MQVVVLEDHFLLRVLNMLPALAIAKYRKGFPYINLITWKITFSPAILVKCVPVFPATSCLLKCVPGGQLKMHYPEIVSSLICQQSDPADLVSILALCAHSSNNSEDCTETTAILFNGPH